MFSLVPKPNGSLQEIVQTEYGGFRKHSLTSVCVCYHCERTCWILKNEKNKTFRCHGLYLRPKHLPAGRKFTQDFSFLRHKLKMKSANEV